MNPLNKISAAIQRSILEKAPNRDIFAEYYNRTDGKKIDWKRLPLWYRTKDLEDWKTAVAFATDPYYPSRRLLWYVYQALLLDNHLASVIDTRILRVQRSSYKFVNDKGEENEPLKTLMERPWYDDLVRLILMRTFQGTTLIEMFDTNENGELARVTEIPQTHFIAQKGVITEYEWDLDGTSYIDGPYKDYYLQVGGDWELGMLNQLAMIVFAKKMGIGSWMSYIDKFGVPPIFATTDRMDDKRTNELFEMLQNFRSNHFAVLKGDEKITIPNDYNADAYKSFQTLIDGVCNKEMSKRVLGGTASTDEKAFVGAATIQERVAQDRYESDKLVFKYYFNTFIRPRLVKLSSVYADLANYSLVWDNQETLEINDYINGVEKLSQFYDFDIAEIKKRTGLPVTGIKAQPTPPAGTPPIPPDPQKKKTKATLTYRIAPYTQAHNIQAATWDAATERLATQIYNGEVKPADLDHDLVLKNYAAFNKEAQTAFGKGYYTEDITRKFRDNLMQFSGAKTYSLMTKLEDIGHGVSRDEFIQKAQQVINLYNDTWINTEKQFTSSSASSARDWQQFVKDKDIYPHLKYRTMEDGHVRVSHAELDGTVKSVDDPFWGLYTPPNGFNCRCFIEQTVEHATDGEPDIPIGDQFLNNPGATGIIFKNDNSYQQSIPQNEQNTVIDNTNLIKQLAPYNHIEETKGGQKVFISDFYDQSDIENNTKAAEKVADYLAKSVYVRPHIQVSGIKNPELGIGKPDVYGDLKTFENTRDKKEVSLANFISNRIKSADKQGCQYAILDITDCSQDVFNNTFFLKIHGTITPDRNKSIKNILVIRGEKISMLDRQSIYDKQYESFLKEME